MAIDGVEVNTKVDANGNAYTSAISNDKLTNDDFLNLMIQELKMQDPTKPMDSAAMMDSQLQMSTIESNVNMSKSMAALQSSFGNTALANSANMIGRTIEDGSVNDNGITNSFLVSSVKSDGDDIILVTNAMTAYNAETKIATYSTEQTLINMNKIKKIN